MADIKSRYYDNVAKKISEYAREYYSIKNEFGFRKEFQRFVIIFWQDKLQRLGLNEDVWRTHYKNYRDFFESEYRINMNSYLDSPFEEELKMMIGVIDNKIMLHIISENFENKSDMEDCIKYFIENEIKLISHPSDYLGGIGSIDDNYPMRSFYDSWTLYDFIESLEKRKDKIRIVKKKSADS